jgi:hypothetical protein
VRLPWVKEATETYLHKGSDSLIVMSVEQRKLLMTPSGYSTRYAGETLASLVMHDIKRVIDITRDRARWPFVAGEIDVDHRSGHAHDLTQVGGILPA